MSIHTRTGGNWKAVSEVHVKVSGTWEEMQKYLRQGRESLETSAVSSGVCRYPRHLQHTYC